MQETGLGGSLAGMQLSITIEQYVSYVRANTPYLPALIYMWRHGDSDRDRRLEGRSLLDWLMVGFVFALRVTMAMRLRLARSE